MKVWLLDNGSIVIEHTQFMWNVPGPQVRIPSYGVLVEHDDGLFLFDTGFDLEHTNAVLPFELPEQTAEQTIPAQLELAGFSTSDVTTLVNSHLHFDHVGGNKHFSGIPNVVHEQELVQARDHEPFEFFGYSDKTWDHDGAQFQAVSGDVELAKGLWLFETPGHTIGHYSLLVSGDSGRSRCCSRSTSSTRARRWSGHPARVPHRPAGGRALDPAREGRRRRARRGHVLLARSRGVPGVRRAPDHYEL